MGKKWHGKDNQQSWISEVTPVWRTNLDLRFPEVGTNSLTPSYKPGFHRQGYILET